MKKLLNIKYRLYTAHIQSAPVSGPFVAEAGEEKEYWVTNLGIPMPVRMYNSRFYITIRERR